MLYVGSHWHGKRCLKTKCRYVCSSTWMNAAKELRPDDFKRRIVYWQLTSDRKELLKVEQRWLDLIPKEELGKRFYNHKRLASGITDDVKRMIASEKVGRANRSRTYGPLSAKTRAKMSAAHRTPEYRAAMAELMRGRKHTATARANMSAAHRTPEYRAAMAELMRGRFFTLEQPREHR